MNVQSGVIRFPSTVRARAAEVFPGMMIDCDGILECEGDQTGHRRGICEEGARCSMHQWVDFEYQVVTAVRPAKARNHTNLLAFEFDDVATALVKPDATVTVAGIDLYTITHTKEKK